jgi:hypothetical protein
MMPIEEIEPSSERGGLEEIDAGVGVQVPSHCPQIHVVAFRHSGTHL